MTQEESSRIVFLKHKSNISEIPKMSQEEQIKCSYYNSGYCKFTKKEKGCKFYHPEETCYIPNCNNKKCPARHPKSCKFGDTCVFQTGCSYKHAKTDLSDDSISIVETNKEIDQLKADIAKLKEENDIKINILAKVHINELEEVTHENSALKEELKDIVN